MLTRFTKERRVFIVEEPVYGEAGNFTLTQPGTNTWVIVPHLENGLTEQQKITRQKEILSGIFSDLAIENYFFWYYNPMFLSISDHFEPQLVIYDCMDELSAFKFAPEGLKEKEDALFKKADLVFTGGQSLYEFKKHKHPRVYPFPSSIDKEHFQQARAISRDPEDQVSIPHPRIGFYGVIDERFDIGLIEEVAKQRPDWQFVLIGPVVKIDPASLPRFKNLHYLGNKSYNELPFYLSGWDIAIIPFALNESTRFISPTKTPEYLAAGKPVISSSIQDVVKPYGIEKLVHIADTAEDFIKAAEMEFEQNDRTPWLSRVDAFLTEISWDNTWNQMMKLINERFVERAEEKKIINLKSKENHYV